MNTDHSLAALCAALDVTRAGYHAWGQRPPSGRAQTDAALQSEIRAIHAPQRGRYGAPRIHAELQARGQRHGRKRNARLLRHAGLRGLCSRRFVPRTTDSRHADPIAPNHLATHPPPTGPNPIWVADLTYVPTAAGWLYVAVIMDLYSRRIIGWAAGLSLATTTVLAALRMAENPYANHASVIRIGPFARAGGPVTPRRDGVLDRGRRPGDTVLDPFAGTGTIFPAGHALKCTVIGIEQANAAFGTCVKRLEELHE